MIPLFYYEMQKKNSLRLCIYISLNQPFCDKRNGCQTKHGEKIFKNVMLSQT